MDSRLRGNDEKRKGRLEARKTPSLYPSNIRVALHLSAGAGVGDGALLGVGDELREFPEGAGAVIVHPRLPCLAPLGELGIAQLDIDRAGDRVDDDDVAVFQQA